MTALAVGPIDFNHVAVAFRLTRYAPGLRATPHHGTTLAQGTGVDRLRPRQGRLASIDQARLRASSLVRELFERATVSCGVVVA